MGGPDWPVKSHRERAAEDEDSNFPKCARKSLLSSTDPRKLWFAPDEVNANTQRRSRRE